MRVAIVVDGIVINVCEADDAWEPEVGLAIGSEEAGPGWLYDGFEFSPPPPPVITSEQHNVPIIAALDAADLKIIRALTEGDTERIAAHKLAQATLRSQLIT